MRIFNQNKTKELSITEINPEMGNLIEDTLEIVYPEIQGQEEEYEYRVIAEYPNGGQDVEKVILKEGVEHVPAHTEKEDILVFIPFSQEELALMDKEKRVAHLENEMDELRKDFAQDQAGLFVEGLEQKKALYRQDYQELCELKGITPKPLKINLDN